MRQRVAFLRTLVAGKPVLALDEPFASLDAISRGEMQEWLAGALRADRRTVLLVSHDIEEALYLADRVRRPLRPAGPDRQGAAGARPARRRPRRRGHRPGLRRRPRGGAAGAAGGRADDGELAHGRGAWSSPPALIAALIGALADRRLDRGDRRSAEPRTVPRPLPRRSRRRALEQPRPAAGKHLGDPARDPRRARRRASSLGLVLAIPMRFSSTPPRRRLPARRRRPGGAGGGDRADPGGLVRLRDRPKVIVVALACFFPILVNTLDGLRSVDPEAVKMMRTLDASRWAIFRRVEAPTALPALLQRRQGRGRGRPDRRPLRRAGRLQLGLDAADHPEQQQLQRGPGLRRDRRPGR